MKKVQKRAKTSEKHGLLRVANRSQEAQSILLINQKMEKFVKREGRRPRILVSNMGKKGHDHDTKLLATFFAETGFDVDISPLRQTPQGTGRMAIENDVHVICFLSTENMHNKLASELAKVLTAEQGGDIRIVIGGDIPQSDYNFLYGAGVGLILNSGQVNFKSIIQLLDILE